MSKKSLLTEMRDTQLAIELIELGARPQVLESETTLSRERLLKLYKELKGMSPPKGMLPFSSDWFLTWQPNIHASIFMNIYRYLQHHSEARGIHAIMKAYRLYLEQTDAPAEGEEPVLSLTRAWTLVRFIDHGLLSMARCEECGGYYVVDRFDLNAHYVCGLCHMPSRAGKTRKAREQAAREQASQQAAC